MATRHLLVFYEVSNLISDAVIAAILLYYILSLLVPTNTFLLDRLIEDTSIIQQKSHLMPKWHAVGDSIHEMVVVGKDHMRKRQRFGQATCYFQWLICKRRFSVYCCCLNKRKGSSN